MNSNGLQPFLDACNNEQSSLTTDVAVACIPDFATHPCCCCGDGTCTFLRQTHDAFESFEQSLRTAGRLGQALLVRHEAYVADAEKEKARMTAEIERLSLDKRELEAENSSIIDENRSLLDQLENVNNAVADSDVHVQSLTATLHSTQEELRRLNSLASRTARLEQELEQYEQEQAGLQMSLAHKTEEEKSAMIRWQSSERKLAALEDQLERIERDARDERERHVEIVGRMERQRIVEKELETASGRLQGSAAAKTMNREKHGSAVVSHFVKDILSDNANLQLGIVELRDMLTNSNEEVERLREQLAHTLPSDGLANGDLAVTGRINDLGQEMSRASTQELHVHHHYHAPEAGRRQSQTVRRPKKSKRTSLSSGLFTPSAGSRTPRSSICGPPTPASTAMLTPATTNTLLSQTSVSIPNRNRWSMQSALTIESSIASSPLSTNYQASSLFDRTYSDVGMDSSRPTTPDSEDLGSPLFLPQQSKRGSGGYFRPITALPFRHDSTDSAVQFEEAADDRAHDDALCADAELVAGGHDAIPEEDEDDILDSYRPSADEPRSKRASFIDDTEVVSITHNPWSRPLRRAASHESLLSVSGLDVHSLKARPSQLLTAHGGRSFSSQAVVSATIAHAARPALTSRSTSDSSRSLLTGMASDQRAASTPVRPTLGKKVGGWVFGRWGSTPTPTVTVSTPLDDINNQKRSSASKPSPLASKLRTPGINQAGPILGLGPEPRRPREPILRTLNEEELRESLNEE
ncbi:hypothetical protein MBLNU459_g5586t1 [Dothideomycetes sp. NU459]